MYTRLTKLGLCDGHATGTRLMKQLSEGYDDQALGWKLAVGSYHLLCVELLNHKYMQRDAGRGYLPRI